MKLHEHSRVLAQWVLPIALSLIPLFFLPITENYYETNKWLLVLVITVMCFIVWAIKSLRASHVTLSLTPATIALGVLALTTCITLFVTSTNKVEAALSYFGPPTFVALFLMILLLPTLLRSEELHHLKHALYTVAGILGLIAVYQTLGVGKTIFAAYPYLADSSWTPTGSTIATASFLFIMLPMILADVFRAWKKGFESDFGFLIIITIATLAGFGFSVWQYILHPSGAAMPLKDGWTIALEVLKNPLSAFFGVGPENYLSAFTVGRSQVLNMTTLWNARFTSSASTLLHIVTTYGLLGGGAFLLILRALFVTKNRGAEWISRILCVLVLCFTPPSLTIIMLTTILLLLNTSQNHLRSVKIPSGNVALRIASSILMIMIIIGAIWPLSQAYSAELLYYQSILTAQKNNGSATYNLLSRAIKKSPQVTRYHIVFSQTSLAIANALAASTKATNQGSADAQKTQANDQQVVAQLIQQAINEGKTAVKLNTVSVLGWENMANIYAQLVNVAQGSDNWAIISYKQAISLDSTNPTLRLQLGSVYYQMKKYTDAITQFQIAIALKPNYANAYYNLAEAYKMSNDITQAVQNMQQAQSLVDKSSDDYRIATTELTNLKSIEPGNPTTTQTQTTPLKPVSPTPTLSSDRSFVLPPNSNPDSQK